MKSLAPSTKALRVPQVHLWLGLSAGLYFLFLALTGIALNHRTDWKLEEKTVSHRFLPSSYRPLDEGDQTRLDIVIADLHSGLLFGKYGPIVNDVVALILMTSTLTGFALAWRRARKQGMSFQTPCERYVASLPSNPCRDLGPPTTQS
jgi:uncharacterized iron-regulated membrane protein